VQRVTVELGERAYDVIVTRGWQGLRQRLFGLGGAPVLITDENVASLYLEAVASHLEPRATVVVPAGEGSKSWSCLGGVVDQLLAAGVDRRTPVVALGGGMVGDLAGLAAALCLRGLPVVQLPTTLLAMVDSSVGGKTAVNHPAGKNLVGAFHQPSLVWANLDTLATLPAAELSSGHGEVVKTALVGDPLLLDVVGDPERREEVVARCVRTKARVVAADEREGGVRAWLNAGHTVGHAVETALGHGRVPHGIAVAHGLVAEVRWAVERGICVDPELPGRVASVLARLGMPALPQDLDRTVAEQAMQVDKKAVGDMMTLPVPRRAGEFVLHPLPRVRLPELLRHLDTNESTTP